jgi:tRNA1(Val) A37 N6-methylase TrmN6
MEGIDFAIRFAMARNQPLVINISFGNNDGSHDGRSLFETYMDAVCLRGRNAIVVGTGNEADKRRHTSGVLHMGRFGESGRVVQAEMQEKLLALAKKTAEYNGFDNFTFQLGKLQDFPECYREQFSLVLCNPPYERGGLENDDYEKAVCRKEITINLQEIAIAISKALKFGGRVAMLHRADRLAEVCYTLKSVNIEVKRIQFVAGKSGAKPYLVMVEGVKGGKPSCEIMETQINAK